MDATRTYEGVMFPSDKADKLMLRMPEGMRPAIKARATENRRSMNSEIILLLEKALADTSVPRENKSAPESAGTLARA